MSAAQLKPGTARPLGVLVALVLLAIILFAVPGPARLAIVALVLVIALFQRGGDAAALIESARQRIYGPI